MAPSITAFVDQHVEAAAELLAARHQTHRVREASPSPGIEDPEAAAVALRGVLRQGHTEGFVAYERDRLIGYLLGTLHEAAPGAPARVTVPYEGAAASQDSGRETYRELYAAAAARWVAQQCYVHFVTVLAVDTTAVDAWFSLGFGQHTITGVRDTEPVPGREPAGVEIRPGEPPDVDAIVRMEDGLRTYQAGSPVFLPHAAERRAAMPQLHRRLLREARNAYWIACRNGDPVSYQLFAPVPEGFPHLPDECVYIEHAYTEEDERNAGVGTALLRRGMAWAREAGYRQCATDWMSANLPASRFWPRHAFRATSYGLCRRVDEGFTGPE